MTSGSENMLYRGDGFVAAPPPIFSAAACCFARDISFPTAWYACNLLAHCTHGAELIAWRYCIDAECKSLEEVARPLAAQNN